MTSAVLLRTDFNTYNSTYADSAIEATFIAIVVKVISLYFFGGYQHPRANSIWKMLRQVFVALALSAAVIVGIYLLSLQLGVGRDFPRTAFILDFFISLILLSASRLAAYWFADPSRTHTETPLDQFKSKWKAWLTEGVAFYSVVGGLLLAYMIFNQAVFGTSTPISGQIKRWWGSMANSAYERPASNWASYFGIGADAYETGQPFTEPIWQSTKYVRFLIPGSDKIDERFFFVLSIAVLFWLVVVFINKKYSLRALTKLSFIPLLASIIIHILSYTATSYGGAKEWYWVSQMILLTLAVSLWVELILRPLQRIQYVRFAFIVLALLYSVSSLNSFWKYIDYVMPRGKFDPNRPYMEVVAYIEANVPAGEIIGMTGGGNVGYFIKDHTIVNLDGLINSNEYFQILKDGNAPVFLHKEGMTVIFANPRLLGLPPYYGQFSPYLERYDSYGGKDLMYLLPNPKY
jgi:hypothetical protein